MSMGCNVEVKKRTNKTNTCKTKSKMWKTIFDGRKEKEMKRISYSTIIIIRNCINYSEMWNRAEVWEQISVHNLQKCARTIFLCVGQHKYKHNYEINKQANQYDKDNAMIIKQTARKNNSENNGQKCVWFTTNLQISKSMWKIEEFLSLFIFYKLS